ncbi:MAG: DUF6230 family protein [Streptosporangiaceae bacterium]|jgi:hypothetical protein
MVARHRTSASAPAGRVRWKRLAVILVPAGAIAATLVGLTAQGAIAANVSVSGQQFLVTATQLNGTGFEQFGSEVSAGSGTQPVIVSGIGSASLSNLCQAVKAGPLTLRLTAGGGSTPVSATNLIVDASSLAGSSATFHGITIGQDAGTLTATPGTAGAAGGFGEQAETVTIRNLVQHTWLTTAGTFTLPGLHVSFGGSCP